MPTRLRLVTIVAERILEDRLTRDVMEAGATGFTVSESRGRGSRGMRAGDIPGEGVRIEVVVSPEVADRIVERLRDAYFPHYAVIAWLADVEVVRGDKYVK